MLACTHKENINYSYDGIQKKKLFDVTQNHLRDQLCSHNEVVSGTKAEPIIHERCKEKTSIKGWELKVEETLNNGEKSKIILAKSTLG